MTNCAGQWHFEGGVGTKGVWLNTCCYTCYTPTIPHHIRQLLLLFYTPPSHLPKYIPTYTYIYEVSFSRDPSFQRNLPELHLGGISQKIFTFGTIGEFRVRNWNWKSNVTNVLTIHICNIIKCWIYDELIYLSGELFTPAKV